MKIIEYLLIGFVIIAAVAESTGLILTKLPLALTGLFLLQGYWSYTRLKNNNIREGMLLLSSCIILGAVSLYIVSF